MATMLEDINRLHGLGNLPVELSSLQALYSDYAYPTNKITQLCNQGLLTRIQQGLYLVPEVISGKSPDTLLIANHLYGPSYVSLESAMQEYGMIPEAVYSVESITMKRTKRFNTSVGEFNYYHVPRGYYDIGVQTRRVTGGYSYLIATAEKALCDHFVKTNGLQVRSRKAMLEYLLDHLRIDPDYFSTMDADIIDEAATKGPKRQTLLYLKEAIKWLS
jgi:predicted transcriptional regulator of viral defense system